MDFYQRIRDIDRRVIFLFIGLSVIMPLIFQLEFPEYPSPPVRAIFDKIESLPEGSKVLLAFDYDPPSEPELQPMATAVMRHCCKKNLKMYIVALWPMGQFMAGRTIDRVIKEEFPDKVYGRDYVNLGYKSGGPGVINVILTDFRKMYPADAYGASIDDIEMMRGVKNLKNMDLIVDFSAGDPGLKQWIQFAGDPGKIPTCGGVTAVSAPLLYPYYPRQMFGIMGGIKGAAEYESALMRRYPEFKGRSRNAIIRMGPQTVAHIVIMAFIVIGNITYFIDRRREKRGK